jgi:hypothetical protein
MVELHGMEGVMRPQDIEKIVETSLGGAKKSLSSAASGDISKSVRDMKMPKLEMPNLEMPKIEGPNLTAGGGIGGSIGGIDLSSITKGLNTSFSSLTSSIKLPDMKDMSMPFSNAFKDFNISFSSTSKKSAEEIAKTPMPKEAFDEFGSNFDEVVAKMAADVADAMPLDAMDQTAAALEYATKRREELESLMNDGQARSSAEWDEILDEAEQLDGQIEKLATKQLEAMTNYGDSWGESNNMMDQVSSDIADAMGGSKAEQAQAKIDAAIAAKEAAQEKLNKLWNEGTDDELNENHEKYAAELRAAKENLNKVIEESMSDLTSGFDDFSDGWEDSTDKISSDITDAIPVDTEFGDLSGAMARNQQDDEARAEMTRESNRGAMKDVVAGSSPTATQSRGITADSFTLGPNGMPIAKPKSTAAAAPDKPAEKQASPGKKINPETGEEYTPVGDAKSADKSADKKGGSSDKASTLDDVVKSLNALNTKMGQLISVNEDGHKASAKAAKSGGANLYNK